MGGGASRASPSRNFQICPCGPAMPTAAVPGEGARKAGWALKQFGSSASSAQDHISTKTMGTSTSAAPPSPARLAIIAWRTGSCLSKWEKAWASSCSWQASGTRGILPERKPSEPDITPQCWLECPYPAQKPWSLFLALLDSVGHLS